jgi:hypothetical protein
MRAPLILALLALMAAPSARACDFSFSGDLDAPGGHIAERQDPRDARLIITTEGGEASLVLTDRVVAIQLSDARFAEVRRKLRHKRREYDDNVLAQTIRTAVLTAVGDVLDHSIEYRVRDIRSVEYRNGRLVIRTRHGHHLFEGAEIDDEPVLESFSAADARAFVREFERVKSDW